MCIVLVMEKLPVQLTADDVHQNPEFCNLLSALTQHISEDGTSWTVKQSMTQVRPVTSDCSQPDPVRFKV